MSNENTNKAWRVKTRGRGAMVQDDFELCEEAIPVPKEGEILTRSIYISVDPTQIGWARGDGYLPAVPLGDVMRAGSTGVVVESKAEGFKPGDKVSIFGGAQIYWAGPPAAAGVRKLPPDANLTECMAVTSGIGLTAWRFVELGKAKAGETVMVTGAAGAVGLLVCQLALHAGCTVVATAGTAEKLAFLKELGVHAAINYKDGDLAEQLRAAAPNGIDIYWENVGGKTTLTAWPLLNIMARVIVCGMISSYTEKDGMTMNGSLSSLPLYNVDIINKRLQITGFLCSDDVMKASPDEIMAELGGLAAAGKIKSKVDIVDGIENYITGLAGLYSGDNMGKRLVRVSDDV
ncbi:unnamed protein product [Chrysoparadoxa australica]